MTELSLTMENKLSSIAHCLNKSPKGPYSQSYGFSSSHVWMRELDHKEGQAPKNWYFQIVVLEKNLESPLDSKEIKPVNPEGVREWKSLSHVLLFATPWTIAHQVLLCPWGSPGKRKSALNINGKNWCWSLNILAPWCKEPTHWKRPSCWERLRARGEGGDRGWDGWMAPLNIQWTWVWENSGSWWWTGKPGMLQLMGLQRVRHNLATEQQQHNGISIQ